MDELVDQSVPLRFRGLRPLRFAKLQPGFTFFHSSVKNQADAAQLVVEIGDSWRAMRA